MNVEELRNAGYTVVIFCPDELRGVDPNQVEDRLVELGWDVIDALRTKKFEDEEE